MSWTIHDNILFSIFNTFGKKYIENQIEKNTRALVALKQPPKWFVVFGVYDLRTGTFTWQNDVNKITYNLIVTNYMPVFYSLATVKKLCKPRVHLGGSLQNVIPYMVSILNKQFKVVRQIQHDKIVYAIVTLDKPPKDSFDFKEFYAAMYYYRHHTNSISESKKK
jgi:hypothetical protein